jgi:Family of unknown function (DUF5681)
MSKTKARASKRPAAENYEVGYGKPPKANRFKQGQSGNPKGRPKGSKNAATISRETLDRKIAIREGGKTRMVSVREGILLKLAEDALKGNIKTAGFLFNLDRAYEANDGEMRETDQDDQEILNAYLKDFEARLNSKGES